MNISVELSNLGPLRSAEVDLADLTLLIGENNTGKTFFATVLHRVLSAAAPFRPRRRRSGYAERTPPEIEEWIKAVLDDPSDVPDSSDEKMDPNSPAMSPSGDTLRWVEEITKQVLQDYGTYVRDSISYAYGAGASLLRRKTSSRHASNCYLRVRNSKPAWEVEIRFDSNKVFAKPPEPVEYLALILDPKLIRSVNLSYSRLRDNFPQRLSPLRVIETLILYSDVNPLSYSDEHTSRDNASLFSSWPRIAVHLPADRTGIMQSHNVLAGAAVRQSARAGIQPIEIETLPGTSADFLSLILEIPEIMSHWERDKSPFLPVVRKLEESMRAKIEIDERLNGLDEIVATTPEGRFPMARASSMLSELAPLLLVLKSPLYVDHLTIDEPEAHLHPEMQIRVASFLAELVNHGMGVVLTTHSDFFITQINNMMRSYSLSTLSGPSNSKDSPAGKDVAPLDPSRVRLLRFSREDRWCVARESEADVVDGVDESTFTKVMRSQYDETARLVNELLEAVE